MLGWTKRISKNSLQHINFACFGFWIGAVVATNEWNSLYISVIGLQIFIFFVILSKNLVEKRENDKVQSAEVD